MQPFITGVEEFKAKMGGMEGGNTITAARSCWERDRHKGLRKNNFMGIGSFLIKQC